MRKSERELVFDQAAFEDLEWAGTGIAMDNAKQALKPVAERVIGTKTKDGLANFEFELLESGCSVVG